MKWGPSSSLASAVLFSGFAVAEASQTPLFDSSEPLWVRLLIYFGPTLVMLVVLARYHVSVVREKDAAFAEMAKHKDDEIKRLNEERMKFAERSLQRVLDVASTSTDLANANHETLNRMLEKKPR